MVETRDLLRRTTKDERRMIDEAMERARRIANTDNTIDPALIRQIRRRRLT